MIVFGCVTTECLKKTPTRNDKDIITDIMPNCTEYFGLALSGTRCNQTTAKLNTK